MDNKIVVVYKTKYGSAKRYAEWIAQEINGDLFEHSKIEPKDLLKYDTIVYGGSLYAVGILGISLIKRNFHMIKDKNIIVFSVGASPAYPEAMDDVKNNNFTEEMKEKIKYFHLRGAFNYSKLSFMHKIMMSLLKKKLKSKKEEELTKEEKGMLYTYERPADWTNKKAIAPIIECIEDRRN